MSKENILTMEEELDSEKERRKRWSLFVECEAANFFVDNKIEKMTIEDGNGSKAKFSRTKDGTIKVEYTSTMNL
ncbi:MAG: hypothetical protein ACOXZM_06205 [Eubacteriales bacterium]|jgi:hypothetical protein